MSLGKVIGTIAPTVATLLGGPLAGLAVEVVGNIFGMPNATKEKVTELLQSGQLSGEQIVKLREAEIALKIRTQELGIDLEKLEALDRASARTLWTSFVQAERLFLFMLAYFLIGAFFYSLYFVLTGNLPSDPNHLVLVGAVIGYASAKADQVVGFFFGSSADSRKKTDQLAEAMRRITEK